MRVGTTFLDVIDRWSVGAALSTVPEWQLPPAALGTALQRRREAVDEGAKGDHPLGSVHFNGTISVRPPNVPKGALFLGQPGDLAFSKIDVRNGAIAVIPDEHGPLAFSTEFPIFEIRTELMLPAYAALVCRLPSLRTYLRDLASGHSGRKRLTPDDITRLRIPLPDLDTQRALVRYYEEAVAAARHARHDAEADVANAYEDLLRELGVQYSPGDLGPGWQVLPSDESESWSVRKARMRAAGRTGSTESTYPILRLGDPDLAEIRYGISKSPRNRPGEHARPYLRVANVQAGALDLSEIKYIEVDPDSLATYRLQAGDLLICEGNSEHLVGRPAMWNDELDECVHQNHVIRVRLNQARLLPVFALAYMNTVPGRDYFIYNAKRTTNLASINSTDVARFELPVPPLDIQNELGTRLADRLDKAWRRQRDAVDQERQALVGFEARLISSSALTPGS